MALEHKHILAGSKRILLLHQKALKIIFIYICVCVFLPWVSALAWLPFMQLSSLVILDDVYWLYYFSLLTST